MDNRISFTARSNKYFAITRRFWKSDIPNTAYKQIDTKRKLFEKFARRNNLKITFTDGNNMLSEFHTGSESLFLSNRLAMEVEKKPSLSTRIKTAFSNLRNKITNKDNKPKVELSIVSYYEKDSKKIPTLKENEKIGFFVEYEPTEKPFDRQINLNTVIDFLQKVSGKKFQ